MNHNRGHSWTWFIYFFKILTVVFFVVIERAKTCEHNYNNNNYVWEIEKFIGKYPLCISKSKPSEDDKI